MSSVLDEYYKTEECTKFVSREITSILSEFEYLTFKQGELYEITQ